MIKIKNLSCRRGDFKLENINFRVKNNEYFIILGPNGAGKSTLLKSLLGFYTPADGKVIFNDRPITELPPEERNIGYIPQDLALFPHLTVRANIVFGMENSNMNRKKIEEACRVISRKLKISDLLNRYPSGLSGGEKQKVALARALSNEPRALFLDEPFASIDRATRQKLWSNLRQVLEEFQIPVIHITHDLEEAYALGDNYGILLDGQLKQKGSREEIFSRPATPAIARFLSYTNIFSGTVREELPGNRYKIKCSKLEFIVKSNQNLEGKTTVCIRPQDIKIVKEDKPLREEIKDNLFAGKIMDVIFSPTRVTLTFRPRGTTGDYDFKIELPDYIYKRYNLSRDKEVKVALWQENLITWPADNTGEG